MPSLLIGLGSAGCSNFRDLFSAHADVAAEAGGQELPVERLAEIVASPRKGVRIKQMLPPYNYTSGSTTPNYGGGWAFGPALPGTTAGGHGGFGTGSAAARGGAAADRAD